MNVIVVVLVGYLFIALQQGLAPAFDVTMRWGTLTPQLVLIFAVYLGLLAPVNTVVWAWAAIGLSMDLLTPTAEGALLIGPYTVSYLAGAFVVRQLRGMVLRTHPISHAFCVIGAGLAVHLVVTAIFGIRQVYDPIDGYAALRDMGARVLAVLYTAPFAAAIAWPMIRGSVIFGFAPARLRQ